MPINPPDPSKPPEQWPDDTLLAVTLWGEARGESVLGVSAVACVILNRLAMGYRHAGSIAKVVLRKWAFSCWNGDIVRADGKRVFDPNTPKLREPQKHDPAGWLKCSIVAELALNGAVRDVTHGATHYCRHELWNVPGDVNRDAKWHEASEIASGRTKETARIGDHVFAKAP